MFAHHPPNVMNMKTTKFIGLLKPKQKHEQAT
jgi:hypothetical protein